MTLTVEMVLRLVVAALAAYRVARMIALEDGPFDVFSRFRARFDVPRGQPRSWIARGVECPLCIGFYASLVTLGLSYVDYVSYGVLWLAAAGLQVALQRQEREVRMDPNYGKPRPFGALWTGFYWEPLPKVEGKTIQELEAETQKLLASGMSAKDILIYLSDNTKAK